MNFSGGCNSTVFEPSVTLLVSQSVNTEGPFPPPLSSPSPPSYLLFYGFFDIACICHVFERVLQACHVAAVL